MKGEDVSTRLASVVPVAVVLAAGYCGGPTTTDARVVSVEAEETCVVTDADETLCFAPGEVDGAASVSVDDCVAVRRKLESGRPYEVEPRPC